MGHVPGFRGPYLGHVPKSGFRGPYGACAENVAQTGIDVSRNYSTLHLRKTKYSDVARVQARTLEINEKILSQGSNLEPDRIIFDKSANHPRSGAFQGVAKPKPSENQRDTMSSGYHWAIRPKLKEGFGGIALHARFPLFQAIS